MAEDAPALETAFEAVADETRVGILRALWAADTDGEGSVSFSDLRERAGVRDSGRFNYHLGRLVPRFVREVGDGYALTYAGRRVVGAAVSGAYTETTETSLAPTPVGDCPREECSGTREVSYEAGTATVRCDTCDVTPDEVPAPPVLVDGHGAETDPAVLGRFGLATMDRYNRGFCPYCSGPVTTTIARLDPEYESVLADAVDVVYECGECGHRRRAGAVATLIGHPAVVAVLHEAGVDHRRAPSWEQTWLRERTETLLEDPVRVRVDTLVDGDPVAFVLDDDLDLVERRSETDAGD